MDKAISLAEHAIRHNWAVAVNQGTDTGGGRWIKVEGLNGGGGGFMVTWHTRMTGTYRLFSCMHGANRDRLTDTSLKNVNAIIEDST